MNWLRDVLDDIANDPWLYACRLVTGLLIVLLLVSVTSAHGRQVARAVSEDGSVTVLLTDEPCALGGVTNLPYRAVWQKKGEAPIQGCFNVIGGGSVIAMYFEDKTVLVFPGNVFSPTTSL